MRVRESLAVVAMLSAFLAAPVSAAEPEDVSLIQLIAAPEKFKGKLVRIVAFLHVEFEGNALYMHKEDYEQFLSKNGIWINLSEKNHDTASKLNNTYVIAVGTFDPTQTGHLGLWSGTLTDIQRLSPWSTQRQKP